MTTEWTKDAIRKAIESNPKMVERSLLKLYERQTEAEKASLSTNKTNNVGFNSVDAFILTSFAEWIKKSSRPEGQRLSEKQREIARRKLMKYAGQLLEICHETKGAVSAPAPKVEQLGMEIAIERQGQFHVNFSGDNSTQCGIHNVTNDLQYRVKIIADNGHLTKEGFIIDNNAIHSYFVETYKAVKDFRSCEHIAMKACEEIKAMFGKGELASVRPTFISVAISGNNWAAGLTATWKAPETTPAAKATDPILANAA